MQAANFRPVPLLSGSASFISQPSFQPFALSIKAIAQDNSAFVGIRFAVLSTPPTHVGCPDVLQYHLSHISFFCFQLLHSASMSRLWHRRTLPCLSIPLHSAGVPAKVLRQSLVLETQTPQHSARVALVLQRPTGQVTTVDVTSRMVTVEGTAAEQEPAVA